jgi:hypothetical protein
LKTEREQELEAVLQEWERLFTHFLVIGKEHGRVDVLVEKTRDVLGRN